MLFTEGVLVQLFWSDGLKLENLSVWISGVEFL